MRGLEAAVTAGRRQVASQQGRLAVLDASIEAAQQAEDDAVDRVADFQSWVERTRALPASVIAQKRPVTPADTACTPARAARRSTSCWRTISRQARQVVRIHPLTRSAVP